MDIRQMNKTHLEHWRGLRKQLWPGHPDDAHLADGEEILQADQFGIICCDGRRGGDWLCGCLNPPRLCQWL